MGKYQMYEIEIDVAADPDEAVNVVRAMLYQKSSVNLNKRIGPAGGNPTVIVRLQEKMMREFLPKWFNEPMNEWLANQCTPPIPGPIPRHIATK